MNLCLSPIELDAIVSVQMVNIRIGQVSAGRLLHHQLRIWHAVVGRIKPAPAQLLSILDTTTVGLFLTGLKTPTTEISSSTTPVAKHRSRTRKTPILLGGVLIFKPHETLDLVEFGDERTAVKTASIILKFGLETIRSTMARATSTATMPPLLSILSFPTRTSSVALGPVVTSSLLCLPTNTYSWPRWRSTDNLLMQPRVSTRLRRLRSPRRH